MRGADAARNLLDEVRAAAQVVRHESAPAATGPIVVSGVLAEQLAKELGADARPGAVRVVTGVARDAEVSVRVIAGNPTVDDEAAVRQAHRNDTPVVVVQLWPQAEWTRPFVLTPFVVECRAGEGFPIDEIAGRIVEASDRDADLAVRVPAIRSAVERATVRRTIVRATALGVLPGGGVRPAITLDQIRMVTRLNGLGGRPPSDTSALVARVGGPAGLVLASGLALRSVAHATRRVLPAPVANGLVAGLGTWAIAQAARRLDVRITP